LFAKNPQKTKRTKKMGEKEKKNNFLKRFFHPGIDSTLFLHFAFQQKAVYLTDTKVRKCSNDFIFIKISSNLPKTQLP
jgi:hypothetical protein